jgi:cyclophilin family peptidyl-prolyl cis-trans isomerase
MLNFIGKDFSMLKFTGHNLFMRVFGREVFAGQVLVRPVLVRPVLVRPVLVRITALLFALTPVINNGPVAAQGPIPDSEHDYLVTLETKYGNMMILLYDDTPMHKENFIELAKAGVYDGNIFHRVIEHFMIQSGDPSTSNITPSWDQEIIPPHVPAEINPKFSHRRGTLGAARYGGERNPLKNSSPTQFYIVRHDRAAPHLDGEYTVFGQVMSGMEVADIIAEKPTDERDRPLEEVRIKRVKVEKVKRSDIMKFYNFTY